MKKAYISGAGRFGEAKVLSAHGFGITFDIMEADLVVFTGGADISPTMYGEPTHGTTKASPYRDDEDRSNYIKATSLGIPLLGICRGAQFICAMSGGSLYQDVDDHCHGDHGITNLETGEVIVTNSVHHQGCIPGPDAITHWLATHKCKATRWDSVVKKFVTVEIAELAEIFTVPRIKAVCVQGHPEFDSDALRLAPLRRTVMQLVDSFQASKTTTPATV